MAQKFHLGAYLELFKSGMGARIAWGGFLARFYAAMLALATINMYAQEGHSYLWAGIAASVIALSNFLISPRISKLIDRHGQSRVIPKAMFVALLFLAFMLVAVHFHVPLWVSMLLSVPMGCMPVVPSVTRARWSYFLRSSHSYDLSRLQTAFAFEGVLDDVAFMLSPSLAIAISTLLLPQAGLIMGGLCYLVGMCIILSSKETEPDIAFMASQNDEHHSGFDNQSDGKLCGTQLDKHGEHHTEKQHDQLAKYPKVAQHEKQKSIFMVFPFVIPICLSACFGSLFYGLIEPATLSLCTEQASNYYSSLVFFVSAISSALAGFMFGVIDFKFTPLKRLFVFACALGILFFSMVFVHDIPTLFLANFIGSFSWAPFVITLNATIEYGVDSSRVTEGLTWVNAGFQLGMVFGPSFGGILLAMIGCRETFIVSGFLALCAPLVLFIFYPVLKKALSKERE